MNRILGEVCRLAVWPVPQNVPADFGGRFWGYPHDCAGQHRFAAAAFAHDPQNTPTVELEVDIRSPPWYELSVSVAKAAPGGAKEE